MLRKQSIILLLLIAGCSYSDNHDVYECQFQRITGLYRATQPELRKSGLLIQVIGRDGRRHMFRRSNIVSCQQVEKG